MTMIILSDYNVSKLRIASEIVNKTDDKRIMFLSDALYLLGGSDVSESIEIMAKSGVKFYALEADVNRRGVDASSKRVVAVSYDDFVKQLLERKSGVINL
jgi:sulfur relay protein TusB/DsrH